MNAQAKNCVTMLIIALLAGFFGTWLASTAIERVGLEMQEIVCP